MDILSTINMKIWYFTDISRTQIHEVGWSTAWQLAEKTRNTSHTTDSHGLISTPGVVWKCAPFVYPQMAISRGKMMKNDDHPLEGLKGHPDDRLKGHFSGLFLNTGKTYRGFLSFPFKPLANKTAWRFRMGLAFFPNQRPDLTNDPEYFLAGKGGRMINCQHVGTWNRGPLEPFCGVGSIIGQTSQHDLFNFVHICSLSIFWHSAHSLRCLQRRGWNDPPPLA